MEGRSSALRITLILAAIAGVVTVVAGLLIVVSSPEEYGLRDSLALGEQPKQQQPETQPSFFKAAATEPPPLPPVAPAPAMMPSTPKRIIVKRLGINAPISSVGLDKRGAIQVPPISNSNLVGWYRHSPTAGEKGPSVMLGHKDTRSGTAVFSRLAEIKYGDQIEVKRQDGTTAVFTVGGVEQAAKTTFPTQRVYGDQPGENAQLHLITCGGTYNRNIGHYTDNIIVYATMTSSYRS
ncbi:class F sortase [Nonomuraea sp. NBC_01738]|uniref:class F sortase n=1 Tax=Nonomuraea sp. NBC_01738 TaxID=2976003 RepID=UPI002E141636|nr:class F sortase [Nonomuraea sp. NBC_01738]